MIFWFGYLFKIFKITCRNICIYIYIEVRNNIVQLFYFEFFPPWHFKTYRDIFWQYTQRSIWHLWYSFWLSIWHIFKHSTSHVFWQSIWHIFWHSTWHSIWHIFWHSMWHILSGILSEIFFDNLSGIFSGILSDIYIYIHILSDIILTFYLAFYLTYILTVYQLWGATVGSNFAALQQHWRTVALKNNRLKLRVWAFEVLTSGTWVDLGVTLYHGSGALRGCPHPLAKEGNSGTILV